MSPFDRTSCLCLRIFAASVVGWFGINAVVQATSIEASTLRELVGMSQVVVVAEVSGVKGLPEGDWIATARVLEVWKGQPRDVVSYGPSAASKGALSGDNSSAQVGERVVLFLENDRRRASLLRIALRGQGRLSVVAIGGKEMVAKGALGFPGGVTVTSAMVGDHEQGVVPMEWLRSFVKVTH